MSPGTLLRGDANARCKVFVCATSEETSETVYLRSYRSPRGRDHLYRSTKVWEAYHATSAAMSFFDPVSIGDFQAGFVDGAIGANNPLREGWNQERICSLWIESRIFCNALFLSAQEFCTQILWHTFEGHQCYPPCNSHRN